MDQLDYENARITASIEHSQRVAEQSKEEMIRIGKPVLPGTTAFGQGIDIISGQARRPLFRINTGGMIWNERVGNLQEAFVTGAGLTAVAR